MFPAEICAHDMCDIEVLMELIDIYPMTEYQIKMTQMLKTNHGHVLLQFLTPLL